MSVMLGLLASLSGRAFAQGPSAPTNPAVQECAQAYESSQEQRAAGEIANARLELERCRKDDCPEFIRRDCARWSEELEAEQPTVPPVESTRSAQSPASAEPKAASSAPASATESSARPAATALTSGPGALPWALLAIGVASLGTGAGLAVWGHNGELQLRDSCSPHCTDAQLDPVRTKYVLSDVSFGVGLVSLPLAAYLFLRHPESEQRAEGTLPVTVVASPSSVQATYGARF